jgi:hypothetical protein
MEASMTADMQAVLERLEKVERQNRRIKRVGLVVLGVVAALVLMAQGTPKSRTVEAGSFILNDSNGTVRAKLEINNGHPSLRLYSATGDEDTWLTEGMLTLGAGTNVVLSSPDEGGILVLRQRDGGRSKIILTAQGDGTLEFYSQGGNTDAGMLLFDKSGKLVWRSPSRQ